MSIEILWKAGEIILKDLNRPHLKVEEIYADNFRFPISLGYHYRRFIVAKIRNVGNTRAEKCLAHLTTTKKPNNEFKLHWTDIPYQPLRDSATKIDLEPNEARDLDIVFSVCGAYPPFDNRFKGSIDRPIQIDPISIITYDHWLTRGTYDPKLFNWSKTRNNEPLTGAWIANPYALYDPEGYPESFLPPGKHEIELDILLSEGTGCGFKCVIESSKDCYQLSILPDTVQILD